MKVASLRWWIGHTGSRLRASHRKVLWLLSNGATAETIPVYIVGSQRSGTGMLGECLGQSPEFENLGESDQRAFRNYSLRDDEAIARLIDCCRYRYLVFKPLKDSHRVAELLAMRAGSLAIWAFRDFSDRINSAVRQFGRHPLDVFESFIAGDRDAWQLQGASEGVKSVIRSFQRDELDEYGGAALMWWVRNSLYFDLEMHRDARIRLWSYDAFVRKPEPELERLLGFLGGRFSGYMLDAVHAHSVRKEAAPKLHPRVEKLCRSLYQRLASAEADQRLDEF